MRSISSGRLNGFGRIADTPSLQDGLRLDVQMRGENDDRSGAEVAGLFQTLQKIPAVDAGHGQIEEDDVGLVDASARDVLHRRRRRAAPETLPAATPPRACRATADRRR